MTQVNRKNFLFRAHAAAFEKYIVPTYASRAEIQKNSEGYWLNVWWHCGEIAPLTVQEEAQALGEMTC